MICEVIIYDFQIDRRMIYILNDEDFEHQERCLTQGDPLLEAMQGNPVFAGKRRWCDLDLMHFHLLILNIIKIIAGLKDCQRGDHADPAVLRLTFFLCSLVSLLQHRSQTIVELLRIKRLAENDLIYDYTATLDVSVPPPKSPLRVVIDNQ